MGRKARVVAVGYPHHITQRGNYQQNTFASDSDYWRFIDWFSESARENGATVLGYCAMPNHTHSIVIPQHREAMAATFAALHSRYAGFVNHRNQQHGHFWQGRYYSCVLDEPHLIMAARYIERNPVRAKLVTLPWQWRWSSAAAHCAIAPSLLPLGDLLTLIGFTPERWRQYILEEDSPGFGKYLLEKTLRGIPCGSDDFISRLETELNCKLVPRPRGRPAKKPAQ